MLQAFLSKADPGLMQWVENNVSFPNSMVDRITPVTTREDIEELKQKFEIDDAWPVKCEPFCQWVIEDKFNNGRPPWEQVGAQFVADVDPYEKMKIRLLNGGHVALGLTGFLCGHKYVHEAASDAILEKFLIGFMDHEVTPVLDNVTGIDLEDYKLSLLSRFKNPHIKDQLTRIVSGNSAKIPKFILPTINEQLKRSGPITRSVAIIAAWCKYVEQAGKPGHQYEIQDEMGEELQKAALQSGNDPLTFLNIKSVFGDLSLSTRFTDIYLSIINDFRTNDAVEVILKYSV